MLHVGAARCPARREHNLSHYHVARIEGSDEAIFALVESFKETAKRISDLLSAPHTWNNCIQRVDVLDERISELCVSLVAVEQTLSVDPLDDLHVFT